MERRKTPVTDRTESGRKRKRSSGGGQSVNTPDKKNVFPARSLPLRKKKPIEQEKEKKAKETPRNGEKKKKKQGGPFPRRDGGVLRQASFKVDGPPPHTSTTSFDKRENRRPRSTPGKKDLSFSPSSVNKCCARRREPTRKSPY